MTAREAVEYIESCGWSETRLGLDRTRELLRALGDPQKKLKFVHVAGSNGKGSTCALLESVLRAAGLRTGLYTSPYIQDFRERIQICGEPIAPERLAAITERVRDIAEAMDDHPSQFELVTAVAMQYFWEQNCGIVVLEVGLGGELDSTNAIDAPEAAVITNIGLEHTEYLGSTLAEIASAKAGIIKSGCSAVCYDGAAEATRVIKSACRERSVPLRVADFAAVHPLAHSLQGQRFEWHGLTLEMPLLGAHQLKNAAVALETLDVLRSRGWSISDEAIEHGFRSVSWPARFEVLSRDPLFILDGGHNPQCAEALCAVLREYLPQERFTFLVGVLADKDYPNMLARLAPFAESFVCVTPASARALRAEDAAGYIRVALSLPAEAFKSTDDALSAVLERSRPTVAFGSLYMAGCIRTELPRALKRRQRKACLAARRALTRTERAEYSRCICAELAALPEVKSARVILSYLATEDEADLAAFHAWARANGKTLAYPVSYSGGIMSAFAPESPEALETGAYGIRAPVVSRSAAVAPEDIDAVIVPCVGFDAGGARIGRGAGYYDRYLPQCKNAVAVLVAFEAQRVPRAVQTEHDCRADIVVTEAGACKTS